MDIIVVIILLLGLLVALPLFFIIWIVIKFFVGLRSPSAVLPRFCKACGSELNPTSMQCYNCGKNFMPTVSKEVEELRIALAQLEKLVDRDEVSKDASAAVVVALQNRLAKITPVPIPPTLPQKL